MIAHVPPELAVEFSKALESDIEVLELDVRNMLLGRAKEDTIIFRMTSVGWSHSFSSWFVDTVKKANGEKTAFYVGDQAGSQPRKNPEKWGKPLAWVVLAVSFMLFIGYASGIMRDDRYFRQFVESPASGLIAALITYPLHLAADAVMVIAPDSTLINRIGAATNILLGIFVIMGVYCSIKKLRMR